VPLLEKEFNPKIAEGLAELAEIAREEEDYWDNEVAGWMGTAVHWSEPEWSKDETPHLWQNRPEVGHLQFVQIQPADKGSEPNARLSDRTGHGPSRGSPGSLPRRTTLARDDKSLPPAMNATVDRLWFLGEPVAVQRRLIKAIAEEASIPLEFKHVDEIARFAAENGPSGKKLPLPLGWKLLRESRELIFLPPDLRPQNHSEDYEYPLPVPGHVAVRNLNSEFSAQVFARADISGLELDFLLHAESLRGPLTIRNWRAGDRFQPAHTKSPKKVKELLTDLHIAYSIRATWPVIACGDEIVWVRGFPVSSKYRAKPGQPVLLIRETTVAASPPA
jgi:tRNA(Ile)-lysidine synthetase-like protein